MLNAKTIKQTGEFEAIDGNGESHTIYIFTEFIDVGRGRLIEGMKSLETADGEHVNRLDKGSYEAIHSGLKLTSTDPAAP